MNKSFVAACLSIMAATSLVFADDNSRVGQSDGNAVQDTSFETSCPLTGSISLRLGYFGRNGSNVALDHGVGGQVEMKFALGASPFDLVVRGHVVKSESDDDKIWGSDSNGNTLVANDAEAIAYGGSAQLQYNFARGATFNPYVAAGGMYEKTDGEYKVRYAGPDGRHVADRSWDDDGFAFVGRGGLEWNAEPAYARLEAGVVSEVYDGDGTQAELNAIVGATVADNLRVELSGTYFTEWEDYYILVGTTFHF
jgi:hypothetical protein